MRYSNDPKTNARYKARKRGRARVRKTKRTKSKMFISRQMVSYIPRFSDKEVLPPRYRTKLVAEAYATASTGVGSGTYRFYFFMNDPRLPFAGTVTGPFVVYNNITFTTFQAPGFLTLCNPNVYRQFRVSSSKLSIDINPGSAQDSIVAVISPSIVNSSPVNVGQALSQRASRSATFTTGRTAGTTRKNTLSSYMPIHTFAGVSYRAIQDDMSGRFNGTFDPAIPIVTPYYWVLNVNTGDNNVLATALDIRIKLEYWVEFFNQINETLP